MSQVVTEAPAPVLSPALPEVVTLAEAAEYLRVDQADVLELAARQELPARKIGDQWRFHKQAIVEWLLRPSARERLLRHAGAMKDDPHLDQMLERIYQERGGVTTQNG